MVRGIAKDGGGSMEIVLKVILTSIPEKFKMSIRFPGE